MHMQSNTSGRTRTLLLSAGLLALAVCEPAFATGPAAASKPWRLDDLLPERLSISADFRARYEYLDEQFRITESGDEGIVVLRTLVDTRFRITNWLTVGAEFQDSRAELSDNALLTTGIVNAAELLRAYGEVTLPDVFGGRFESRFGRITLDVGSRRLVARNRFRNTLNAFTGVGMQWSGEYGRELRAFWLLPIQRLPFAQDALRNNEIEFDHESLDVQFWGLFGAAKLPRIGAANSSSTGCTSPTPPRGRPAIGACTRRAGGSCASQQPAASTTNTRARSRPASHAGCRPARRTSTISPSSSTSRSASASTCRGRRASHFNTTTRAATKIRLTTITSDSRLSTARGVSISGRPASTARSRARTSTLRASACS
jgi:hypothetical protein